MHPQEICNETHLILFALLEEFLAVLRLDSCVLFQNLIIIGLSYIKRTYPPSALIFTNLLLIARIIFSAGLISGEYGGVEITFKPISSNLEIDFFDKWILALSITKSTSSSPSLSPFE